jgi:plastocyanin
MDAHMFRPALAMPLLLASWVGCSRSAPPPAPAPAAAAENAPVKAAVSSAGAGTVHGTVKLIGTAPAGEPINMKSDPYCAKQQGGKTEEVVVGAGGGLKNVVVHVAGGLAEKYSPRASEAVMDQQGCMYRPRVLVAQAGQTVLITNSDQTLHNIHTYKGTSTLFNQAEVFGMPPIKKRFASSGEVIKFKCDVHPWMTGFLLLVDNPFYAVTGDDGSFNLPDVPAGTYTIEAWHERLGTQKSQVTVAAGKTSDLSMQFAAK